jgi:hypothetical protein
MRSFHSRVSTHCPNSEPGTVIPRGATPLRFEMGAPGLIETRWLFPVDLTKEQSKCLRRWRNIPYWPAGPCEESPYERSLIALGLLEIVKTDEHEYRIARLTPLGRRMAAMIR